MINTVHPVVDNLTGRDRDAVRVNPIKVILTQLVKYLPIRSNKRLYPVRVKHVQGNYITPVISLLECVGITGY
jgi:hypothetical protein